MHERNYGDSFAIVINKTVKFILSCYAMTDLRPNRLAYVRIDAERARSVCWQHEGDGVARPYLVPTTTDGEVSEVYSEVEC